eukprot:gene20850-27683_t
MLLVKQYNMLLVKQYNMPLVKQYNKPLVKQYNMSLVKQYNMPLVKQYLVNSTDPWSSGTTYHLNRVQASELQLPACEPGDMHTSDTL